MQPCLSMKYIVPRVGTRVAAMGTPTPTRAVGEICAERENVLGGATHKVWSMVPVDYP